jgi:UDP-N-acetyl-D-glucosamine dehydrogenase
MMQYAQVAVHNRAPVAEPAPASVAVVGLGYVGLPTSLALAQAGFGVVGIDTSDRRLRDIRAGHVDVIPEDRRRLDDALLNPQVLVTSEIRALSAADAVLICVPTPVDADRRPDLGALRAACQSVVAHARPGQLLVLTSTSHVGATRELLVEPLARRGLIAGSNCHVAFSPERIDPGSVRHPQHTVPRVVGGATASCAEAAVPFLGEIAESVVVVRSTEAAELTKLYENSFRAVNIALANELADIARGHGLDAVEIVDAAGTKPYGFMPFYPGPGVGGHCIPCDPHYLLEPLDRLGTQAPVIREAMRALHARPRRVVRRAVEILAEDDVWIGDARVLVVGAAYKPGISDLRESPGVEILNGLRALRARVDYLDPLVASLETDDGMAMLSVQQPDPRAYDLVITTIVHPGSDLSWINECERVLDCTYRLARKRPCHTA